MKQALRKTHEYRQGQFVTLITLPADEERRKPTLYLTVSAANELAGRRKVLMLRSLAIPWSQKLGEEVMEIFQLTPAETELSELLVQGNSLGQIAKVKNRSVETVRVQLKSVFRKTYSKTQADLVRTILMFSVVIAQSDVKQGKQDPQQSIDHITLPDGREMSIRYFGDENGAPILFLHGMMDAFGGPIQMAKALEASGLKFVCPARAGFGNSSPVHSSGEKAKRQITDDLVYVTDRLDLQRFTILGHLSGGAYAFPLASAVGDRASAIINVSGAVPIRSVKQIQAMSLRQKVVALTAKFRPELLPPLLRLGISQIDSNQYYRFLNALFRRGSADRKLIERQDLYDILARQYRWSVLKGYEGFRLDASIVTTNWFRDVGPWKCRTILMHGEHDPTVKHDSASEFAANLSGATFESFPDGGQLLLYQYPDRVISTITKNL
ncbi:alpha/beta fold hydrolase [Parasphingorhabdus sp.]|uniref:alpha/beta fold hydrolase n=1 Tax=Parasphingorhabdus sp. TaxID=2709688 RepID=UPI003A927066